MNTVIGWFVVRGNGFDFDRGRLKCVGLTGGCILLRRILTTTAFKCSFDELTGRDWNDGIGGGDEPNGRMH